MVGCANAWILRHVPKTNFSAAMSWPTSDICRTLTLAKQGNRKHAVVTARLAQAMGYLRIIRPGSVIGPQQQYLKVCAMPVCMRVCIVCIVLKILPSSGMSSQQQNLKVCAMPLCERVWLFQCMLNLLPKKDMTWLCARYLICSASNLGPQ